jgi:hypothetical protein
LELLATVRTTYSDRYFYCTQLFSNQPNKIEIKIKGDKSSKGTGTKRDKSSLILQNGAARQAKNERQHHSAKFNDKMCIQLTFFWSKTK